jgi:hypothetical protein
LVSPGTGQLRVTSGNQDADATDGLALLKLIDEAGFKMARGLNSQKKYGGLVNGVKLTSLLPEGRR